MFDQFTKGYLTAFLFAENDQSDENTGGAPLDNNYSIADIDKASVNMAIRDCQKFQRENKEMLEKAYKNEKGLFDKDGGKAEYDEERAGHDFYLTRQHHGAGFWDGDLPDEVGEALTKAAHAYPELNHHVNEQGKVVLESEETEEGFFSGGILSRGAPLGLTPKKRAWAKPGKFNKGQSMPTNRATNEAKHRPGFIGCSVEHIGGGQYVVNLDSGDSFPLHTDYDQWAFAVACGALKAPRDWDGSTPPKGWEDFDMTDITSCPDAYANIAETDGGGETDDEPETQPDAGKEEETPEPKKEKSAFKVGDTVTYKGQKYVVINKTPSGKYVLHTDPDNPDELATVDGAELGKVTNAEGAEKVGEAVNEDASPLPDALKGFVKKTVDSVIARGAVVDDYGPFQPVAEQMKKHDIQMPDKAHAEQVSTEDRNWFIQYADLSMQDQWENDEEFRKMLSTGKATESAFKWLLQLYTDYIPDPAMFKRDHPLPEKAAAQMPPAEKGKEEDNDKQTEGKVSMLNPIKKKVLAEFVASLDLESLFDVPSAAKFVSESDGYAVEADGGYVDAEADKKESVLVETQTLTVKDMPLDKEALVAEFKQFVEKMPSGTIDERGCKAAAAEMAGEPDIGDTLSKAVADDAPPVKRSRRKRRHPAAALMNRDTSYERDADWKPHGGHKRARKHHIKIKLPPPPTEEGDREVRDGIDTLSPTGAHRITESMIARLGGR